MTRVILHVGTYAEADGKGLCRVEYDPEHGFTLGESFAAIEDASFGVWSERHRLQFLVHEQAAGKLAAYRPKTDQWARLALVSTEGREPCYVALDPKEERIAVANYGSGSLALIDLNPEGIPSGDIALWANDGGGPNPERQEASHVHCVRFSRDGQSIYAVDLGADQVLRFELGATAALEKPEVAWQAPPGSGPRHLLLHPSRALALLVSELASTLTLFDIAAHKLIVRETHSTLPPAFSGESLGGHLAMNRAGDRVYVTNRGHDSVAVFALDPATAALTLIQHISSEGASPRFFLLLEEISRLILVNEEAGTIVALALDADGRLSATDHRATTSGAVFVTRVQMTDDVQPNDKVDAKDQQNTPPRDGAVDFLAGPRPDGVMMTGEEDPLAEVDDPEFAKVVAAFAKSEDDAEQR